MQNIKNAAVLLKLDCLYDIIIQHMRRIIIFLTIFFLSFSLFAFSASDIKLFTLENGLKVYFLEDSSSPVVRLELCVNAGFTNQGRNNGGLFTMYARLCGGEISNDCVRFVSKAAPTAAEKAVIALSSKLKPLNVSDFELSSIINTMSAENAEYSSSAAGFINGAIDSKVFPLNPWSRESGVLPGAFSSKRRESIRSELSKISENYYIPSNSILFVSGNITEAAALALVKKYFLQFPSGSYIKPFDDGAEKIRAALEDGKMGKARKFVLFHKDFSDEMTQIVVQYTSLESDEADCLSSAWNQDGSAFKKLLLKQRNLKILGDEYIDVSSAQEKSASRLIIQSLLGKAKANPVVQAGLFLSMSRDDDVFSDKELQKSLKKAATEFTRLSESSDATMEQFSRVLASSKNPSAALESFFEKNERLSKIDMQALKEKVLAEEPFVFVFVNQNVYQKYASEFKKAGFEVILQKESAWYNQTAYKNLLKDDGSRAESDKNLLEEIASSADRFISKNLDEFSSFTLGNGIPVTVKRSENSKTAVLSLTIAGGELLFCDKVPGLASVLSDSIAVNINRQLDLFASNGAISGFYEVSSKTLSTHSIITVTCLSGEFDFAIQAAYTALVYCDITPATADGVTYDERTQWRLKSGSTEFQLLCEAVRLLYGGTDYPKLYRDGEDKPAKSLDFTKILEAYPLLLDSTRFSLILSGGLPEQEKLQKGLESTFAMLTSIQQTRSTDLRVPSPDFAKLKTGEKKLALRHLFLTDISKEEAGPRPAVLIPTTKFLDPALYCLPSPDLASTDLALFDALLIETAARMEARLTQKYPETKVKAQLPDNDLPFARIVVTSVEHTEAVDSAYSEAVSSIKKDISREIEIKTEGVIDLEKTDLLARLENNWLMAVIGGAASQAGTARLMQGGEVQKNPKLYLNQYQAVSKAKPEDYFLIAESYFDQKAPLRLYSKDSKK